MNRRHAAGGRTAQENIADLVDPGSLIEYGRFTVAAQRRRRELDDLIARTPADGLIAGTARINADATHHGAVLRLHRRPGLRGCSATARRIGSSRSSRRCAFPTVFFAEGGGGRPGDTDFPTISSLEVRAFKLWAALSGVVPRIAIVKTAASPATP